MIDVPKRLVPGRRVPTCRSSSWLPRCAVANFLLRFVSPSLSSRARGASGLSRLRSSNGSKVTAPIPTNMSAGAGGLAGLAVGSLSAAIGNSARKAAAAREAAARWRLVGAYRIYVTTERIAFEGGSTGREWQEVWLRDLRRVEVDGSTLELLSVGQPASRVHAAPAEYWALLLRRVAFDEVPGQLGA